MTAFYGNQEQNTIGSAIDGYVEEIRLRGYAVIPNVFSAQELEVWRTKIDAVYAQQEKEFGGPEALDAIQEKDVARAPLIYDRDFLGFAMQPIVMQVVHKILGEWAILSLQNAIINRPNTKHHQSTWHRDLPHAKFIALSPIAINALYAIDAFSEATGGTQILPFTHQSLTLPSAEFIEKNAITANVPAGSVILFDSLIFQRAGVNTATITRRAVNQLYTLSLIKQQYDFPAVFGDPSQFDEPTQRMLGYPSRVLRDDKEFRAVRAARLKKAKAA